MRNFILLLGLLVTVASGNLSARAGVETETGSHSERNTSAKTFVWRIAKSGELQGYLVGSLHLLPSNAYPLDPAYKQAFDRADVLAFEANYDRLQRRTPQLIQRLGLYPRGETLQQNLPPKTFQQLTQLAQRIGLPKARLQRMEPWLASTVITVQLAQQAGYSPKLGLDRHFFNQAKQAGKPRKAFESPKQQFQLLDGLSQSQQAELLAHELDKVRQSMAALVQAWKQGDAAALERILEKEFRQKAPEVYRRVIVERNRTWMDDIRTLLAQEDTPLIVVGAGHVVGDRGLATKLRERGYTLQRR